LWNTFWLGVKFIFGILVSLFFLLQVMWLISEVKGFTKPVAISGHLNKPKRRPGPQVPRA
jgi:hypothetical protein